MTREEKVLSSFLKTVFWFVVVNSAAGALSLILFPDRTETLFFWKITPPINAMLVGSMYLVASVAVGYAALGGTWESARLILAMGFGLSVVLLVGTLIHVDRFVPGAKLYYWLFVYFIFPVSVAIVYWQYEKGGTNWQVIRQPVHPNTRLAALVMGTSLLLVAVVGFIFPNLYINIGIWKTSELMIRVFVSWVTALSISNLWFLVEKEWTRISMVPYMLIATPVVVITMMVLNLGDLTGSPFFIALYGLGLAAMAAFGGFMLWNQRQA